MGIRLMVEILDHAPADLTSGELVVLLVLAEYANDATREAWPGIELLSRRARLRPDSVSKALRRLSRRGLEVRLPIAWTSTGAPVFAHHGRQTSYRIPPLRSPDHSPAMGTSMPGPQSGLNGGEARTTVRESPDHSPLMPGPQSGPSPHEPSIEPSTAAVAGRAEALATIRQYTDDDEIAETILALIAEREPRSIVAYVKKIAGDGGMNDWIERAYERWGERVAQAQRLERAAFMASLADQPYCEHDYPGGHIRDPHGWVACPIERKAGGDPWQT